MKTSPVILAGFALAAGFGTCLAGATATFAQHFMPPPSGLVTGGFAEVCGQGCQREACDCGVSVRVVGGQVASATNGVNWVPRSVPTPSRLRCVAGGRGVFVAVGDEGALVTSRDGVRWTLRDSSTDERLRCIVYAQNLFVAVGYGGTIITSKDGLAWKQRNSGMPDRLQGVAYGNDTFVAVGWNGGIVTSRDGRRWSQQLGLEGSLQSVVFRNDVFVTGNPQGANWISRNGIIWWTSQSSTNTVAVCREKLGKATTPTPF